MREDLSLLTESASLEPLSFSITSLYGYISFYGCWGKDERLRKSSETELFWLVVMIESKGSALLLA